MGGYNNLNLSGGYLDTPSPVGVNPSYTGLSSPHYVSMTNGGLGPSPTHMGHGVMPSGMGAAPATASPSSSSSVEDFYLGEMAFPSRMKKKGRKPKPVEPGQTGVKRKSREGSKILFSYSIRYQNNFSLKHLFSHIKDND